VDPIQLDITGESPVRTTEFRIRYPEGTLIVWQAPHEEWLALWTNFIQDCQWQWLAGATHTRSAVAAAMDWLQSLGVSRETKQGGEA
jgi:hypothetical protein